MKKHFYGQLTVGLLVVIGLLVASDAPQLGLGPSRTTSVTLAILAAGTNPQGLEP